jgi:hypothetical protein
MKTCSSAQDGGEQSTLDRRLAGPCYRQRDGAFLCSVSQYRKEPEVGQHCGAPCRQIQELRLAANSDSALASERWLDASLPGRGPPDCTPGGSWVCARPTGWLSHSETCTGQGGSVLLRFQYEAFGAIYCLHLRWIRESSWGEQPEFAPRTPLHPEDGRGRGRRVGDKLHFVRRFPRFVL